MDIGSLLQQVGGAGAIAQHLGVDEATVERGTGALLPQVQNSIENQGLPLQSEEPQVEPQGGLGGIGGMLGGLLQGGAGTGGILGGLLGGGIGNAVLGHIFGSKDRSREVANEASQQSGVDPSVLKKLLPIIAGAVAMHYMTRARHSGTGGAGGGGILGSVLGGL